MFSRQVINVAVAVVVLLAVAVGAAWAKRRQLKPVSADVIKKITEAAPAKATAKPAKPRKVLVFWLCQGFFHGAIPVGNKAFEIMGSRTGAYETVVSDDLAIFDADKLNKFDAVIFNNTTSLKFSESQRKSLMDFVKGGKGVVGIHGATDNFYDWPEAAKMMGGLFSGHPWGGGGTWAVKLDEPDHPLNKAFGGKGFLIKDEIYQLKAPYSRDNLRVLLSLDMSHGPTAGRKGNRADKDNAVAWIRQFGKGRVFYCSLGHNNEIFWNKAVVQHYLDGIQYALGDLKADATPSAKLKEKPTPALAYKGAAGAVGEKGKAKGGPQNQIAAALMGDYEGKQKMLPRESPHVAHSIAAAQVIALGGGEHRVNLLRAFDRREKAIAVLTGKVQDAKLVLSAEGGWSAVIEKGVLSGSCSGIRFALKKVTRLSTTMGAKPPAGAVVILGPKTKDLTAEWVHPKGNKPSRWKLLPDGVMQCVPKTGSVITKKKFGKHKVHLEFRTTFSPTKRGQGRGNSGVYLQGRYEVQILDSYGLEGRNNECGGIYKVAAPLVNMCAPPLQWQTYDITFDAAVVAGDKATGSPKMALVLHNGVKIHENVKLPGKTTAAPKSGTVARGGLYLQDHGHPIEFRNIWVQELK